MATNIHHALFPVPTYLTFQAAGIDISDQSIKYACLKPWKGEFAVSRFGTVSVPEGVVASGKIVDRKRLTALLADIREKEKLSFVRISLPEEQLFLFDLHVPTMPYADIRNTVELSLEEHVPIKAEECVFDFTLHQADSTGYGIKVSAAPRAIVEDYMDVCAGAGLTPVAFELEAKSVARAVVPRTDKGTCMIVDFGETRTGISIVSDQTVLFAVTVDIGGRQLTQSIQKALNVSPAEAEHIKKTQGILHTSGQEEASAIVLNTISIFRDEINKHYIYWHTHKNTDAASHPDISAIILCGGNASLPGLADYLFASLGVRVELANPWVNINSMGQYIPELRREEALGYATALGLALRAYEYD